MREHILSSTRVKIVCQNQGTIEIDVLRNGGDFRNQLLRGFLEQELLDTITITIDGHVYDAPSTGSGVSVEAFFNHIGLCLDIHEAFYDEDGERKDQE